MEKTEKSSRKIVSKKQSHIPKDSVLFEKIVPIMLIGMVVLTTLLILLAAGIIFGVFEF
jgi:hypothetical protein